MIVRICVLVVVLLVSACARKPPAEVADLVILDAGIVTMNSAQPDASALAVRSGKIAYVGDDAGAQGWIGKNTRVLRLKGVTVLPGLIDTHIHLMDGALALDYCTLGDKELTLAQIAPLVRECAERTPGDRLGRRAGSEWRRDSRLISSQSMPSFPVDRCCCGAQTVTRAGPIASRSSVSESGATRQIRRADASGATGTARRRDFWSTKPLTLSRTISTNLLRSNASACW